MEEAEARCRTKDSRSTKERLAEHKVKAAEKKRLDEEARAKIKEEKDKQAAERRRVTFGLFRTDFNGSGTKDTEPNISVECPVVGTSPTATAQSTSDAQKAIEEESRRQQVLAV